MLNRAKPLVVLFLALGGLALLGYSQAWANPPKAQTIIFDDDIRVQFAPNGNVIAVSFLEEDCTPTADDDCWRDAEAQAGVICVCNGADCDDDLQTNLDIVNSGNPDGLDIALDCHYMTNSGPRSTGCPLRGSRSFSFGGFVFSP